LAGVTRLTGIILLLASCFFLVLPERLSVWA